MEDYEEIEAYYEKEMENADKEFLALLQNPKPKENPEVIYKKKIKYIRDNYEKKYEKYLKRQKGQKEKKEKPNGEKQENSVFKVKGISLKPTLLQRLAARYDFFRFKLRIRRRNIFHAVTPGFMLAFWIKLKMSSKRSYRSAKTFTIKKAVGAKESSVAFIKNTAGKIIRMFSRLKTVVLGIIKKVSGKLKRKKNDTEKKTEDQLLAEKILAKSS